VSGGCGELAHALDTTYDEDMPSRRRGKPVEKKAGRAKEGKPLLWPLGLVLLLVEIFVLPASASPFRIPKMALALTGLALTLLLPAALSLWSGTLPRIRSRLVWSILALPVLQLLSVTWAIDRRTAIATAAATAIWCAAILLLALMDRAALGRLALWSAAGAAISAAVGVLQLLHVPILVVEGVSGRKAITGLTGNPADLAMAALLLLPVLLFTSKGSSERSRNSVLFLGAFLLASAVATQTLTALVAGPLLVLVWLFHQPSRRRAGAAAVVVVIVLAGAVVGGLTHRMETTVRELRRGNWYQLLSARADGWTAAVEMIRQAPITGVGAGCFGGRFYPARLAWLEARGEHGARGEISTHFQWTHCDPLQLLAELGIPGLVWLAIFVVLLVPRVRGDPVALASLAVSVPFLLLHYPTHLAVGLVPLTLSLAHLLAGEPQQRTAGAPWQRPLAVVTLLAVLGTGWWQVGVVRAELWRGSLERVVRQAMALPGPGRERALRAIVRSIEGRLENHPGEFPWLATSLGNTLLAANDPAGAAKVFRRALARSPTATAELGLGLALAAQGRTNEALEHLARAGRVNPTLLENVGDPALRDAARRMAKQS